MLLLKKLFILSILLGSSSLMAKSLLDEMIDEMNEVQTRFERRFNKLNEELKKSSMSYNLTAETANIAITENKATGTVDVVIAPLAINQPTFDASMNQDANALNVTTPSGNAIIHVDRHFISVNFNHQLKQEQDAPNGKGKQQVMMSSYSQSAKTVSAEVDLEDARIEYDQVAQKLTISIPLRKKVVTKIPVTVKEKADK